MLPDIPGYFHLGSLANSCFKVSRTAVPPVQITAVPASVERSGSCSNMLYSQVLAKV